MSKTTERIEREIGIPGLGGAAGRAGCADRLTIAAAGGLPALWQTAARPPTCCADYESSRFVRPATITPQTLIEWERAAFASLSPEFEALELSPVAPLGTCSAVGLVDQNKVVSTSRNTEVVSELD